MKNKIKSININKCLLINSKSTDIKSQFKSKLKIELPKSEIFDNSFGRSFN